MSFASAATRNVLTGMAAAPGVLRCAQEVLWRRHVGNALVFQCGQAHHALAVHDVGHRRIAQRGLREQRLAQTNWLLPMLGARSSRSLPMLTISVRMILSVLFQIGVSDVQRILDDRSRLLVEAVVECARKRRGRGDGEHQRRAKAVIRLNSATMRACKRARHPASPGAREADRLHRETATMAITSSTFSASATTTTSSRGTIGVRLVRIR